MYISYTFQTRIQITVWDYADTCEEGNAKKEITKKYSVYLSYSSMH